MGKLFKRISNAISTDIHELLDEKEQKNPIAALNQYLRESEKETEKVRKLMDRQNRLKSEFSREYLQAKDMADKRKRQSEVALKAKEESMYQFALKEYEEYQARTDRMKAMRDEASEQLDMLEQKYEEMKHRLKDIRLKRMELMGRENIARAHHQINKVMDKVVEKPTSYLSEVDAYIRNLEYKVNSDNYRNGFDARMDQLERKMKQEV